ncbi:MAG TPA: hypothetical protein VMD30_01480, partial [Tepidisphaeraceae bacterium]|nr:hypothetical protein [Tepidisphaeraceae bacterium]
WQHECMVYAIVPGTAVYDAGYKVPRFVPGFPKEEIAMLQIISPPVTALWPPLATPTTTALPSCWVNFCRVNGWTYLWFPRRVIYLGLRRSHGGLQRFVAVAQPVSEIDGGYFSFASELEDRAVAITPGSLFRPAHDNDERGMGDGPFIQIPSRFFAGQSDAADPSHFTIDYEWDDGVRGTVDGWLLDNGLIHCQVRPGPGDEKSEFQRLWGKR